MPSLFTRSRPAVAVDLNGTSVSAARFDGRRGRLRLLGRASRPLPPESIVPAPNASNLESPDVVREALADVLSQVDYRPGPVALVIPDGAVKVSVLSFEEVPERPAERDELIRWRMRKAVPYRIEDAQVSAVASRTAESGEREFLVVAARRDIVREYETALEAVGARPGVVEASTFCVINAMSGPSGGRKDDPPMATDWLLLNTGREEASVALLRSGSVVFYRHRPLAQAGDLFELVHQSVMYYEDHLGGGGLARVVWRGASDGSDHVRENLERELGVALDPLDLRSGAELDTLGTLDARGMDALAPLVGIMQRWIAD